MLGKVLQQLCPGAPAQLKQHEGIFTEAISHQEVHSADVFAGVGLVRDVAQSVDTPIIGIGGINPQRAAGVVAAGGIGVAVIGAILLAKDPERAAAELRNAIEDAEPDGRRA